MRRRGSGERRGGARGAVWAAAAATTAAAVAAVLSCVLLGSQVPPAMPTGLAQGGFDRTLPPEVTLIHVGAPSQGMIGELAALRRSAAAAAAAAASIEVIAVGCSLTGTHRHSSNITTSGGDSARRGLQVREMVPSECREHERVPPATLFVAAAARAARGAFVVLLEPPEAFRGRLTSGWLARTLRTAREGAAIAETKGVRHSAVVCPLLVGRGGDRVVGGGIEVAMASMGRAVLELRNAGDMDGRAWGDATEGRLEERFAMPLGGCVSPRRLWADSIRPPAFADDAAVAEARVLVEARQRGARFFLDGGAQLVLEDAASAAMPGRLVEALGREQAADRLSLGFARAQLAVERLVVWDLYCGCTGVNAEAVQFLVPLARRAHVAAVAGRDCFCRGYAEHVQRALARVRERPIETEVAFWVSHKPPQNYPRFPYKGVRDVAARPRVVIGRSMSEWEPISAEWVAQHELVDEIWVPTEWHKQSWAAAGVPAGKLQVVPEAIDPHMYSPATTQPEPLPGVEDGAFVFLSVFKWEKRKGPDILLDAYFREFAPGEAVALVLHTYLYGASRSERRSAEQSIEGLVRQAARNAGFSEAAIDAKQLPKVILHTRELSAAEMPRLYRACDAFVLATRGEGWGLPVMEAMAMGLPTAATNWSGCTAFLDSTVGFPIAVEKLEPVDTGSIYPVTGIEKWAKVCSSLFLCSSSAFPCSLSTSHQQHTSGQSCERCFPTEINPERRVSLHGLFC